MTTPAQSIIKEAQEQLHDVLGAYWSATELVAHLNDGQRDVVTLRPDMAAKAAALVLVAGPKQALPADCHKLIEIARNTSGAAIRQTDRNMLDAVDPGWYSNTGVTAIKHFMHDPRDPGVFWVYPPAAATGASVDLIYAAFGADVATPSGAAYSTVSGNITVNDVFKNALLHWVLFRAFAKESEAGNVAMSAAHYQMYKAALGDDAATRQAVKPTVKET